MDEFTLQIHEIWPSLNPYGPSKCSGGVFERSIWNSKCSGGAFRILNAPLRRFRCVYGNLYAPLGDTGKHRRPEPKLIASFLPLSPVSHFCPDDGSAAWHAQNVSNSGLQRFVRKQAVFSELRSND